MIHELLPTLIGYVEAIRPALTAPGFKNALVVMVGWVLTSGPHAITAALVATEVAERRHHERFHRFFSRGAWQPDDIGLVLFDLIVKLLPDQASICADVDDTLAVKRGENIYGIGNHIDPVRSTKAMRVFAFGHVWVVMAIVVRLPFSHRPWALPVLFRLYRSKKECAKKGHSYRKKTELARDMLDILVFWAGDRPIRLCGDNAYCNSTVLRDLPETVVVFGAMRPDAVLTALPEMSKRSKKGGRPRVRGKVLPKPKALARDRVRGWSVCQAMLYGKKKKVRYKTLCGPWSCFREWPPASTV